MNSLYVDLIVLAVVALSALFAFMRGFLREALSIGAWIVAGLAAWFGLPLLRHIGRQYIEIELVADTATAVAIFIAVLIVVTIISHFLTRGVRESALGPLDRSLGLLFGLIRGALIVCIGLMITDQFFDRNQRPDWITQAKTYRLVDTGANVLYGLIPPSLLERSETAADAVKTQAQQAVEVGQAIQVITGSQPEDAADSGAADGDSGYKDAERSDLDRLIQGTQ